MNDCNYECCNCPDEKLRSQSTNWKVYCKSCKKFNDAYELKQELLTDLFTGESVLHTYVVPKK